MKNILKIKFYLYLFLSCFIVVFSQTIPLPNATNCNPCEENITADRAYALSVATGDYSVWLGCGHTEIEKPFIYVEGIDFVPQGVPLIGNLHQYESNDPIDRYLYRSLMERGFDVIQLDFNQNPQYIQRNAELLITLINDLNDQIDGNGQEIVVMGESMGAIVARYALTQMENYSPNTII